MHEQEVIHRKEVDGVSSFLTLLVSRVTISQLKAQAVSRQQHSAPLMHKEVVSSRPEETCVVKGRSSSTDLEKSEMMSSAPTVHRHFQ